MSAYIVDRSHIAYMVEATVSHAISAQHDLGMSWVWNIDRAKGTYSRAELRCIDYEALARVGQMLWNENVKSVRFRYPDCTDDLPGPIGCDYQYGEHRLAIAALPGYDEADWEIRA